MKILTFGRLLLLSTLLFALPQSQAQQSSYPISVKILSKGQTQLLWELADYTKSPFCQYTKKFKSQARGVPSLHEWLFDQLAHQVDLSILADVDLLIFKSTSGQELRLPRFLVWKGLVSFECAGKNETTSGLVVKSERSRLFVPEEFFKLSQVKEVVLANRHEVYPGTKLSLRTNPAASRGEKLYTQSCLACHSLQKLAPASLQNIEQSQFKQKHRSLKLELDAKQLRGLVAYSEALVSVKSTVKSKE